MGLAGNKLSESDRIDIARSLFEVKDEDRQRGELHGLCPIHGENNPSFSYSYKKDTFNCLSCEASGDLVKLWIKVKGYSDNREGFKAFCDKYEIGNKTSGPSAESSSKVCPPVTQEMPYLNQAYNILAPLPESWLAQLTETRGWSRETMELLGIRLQTFYQKKNTNKLVKLNNPERIAIPIRDKQDNVRNIRLYKPGAKNMKIISWGSQYGSARLFPAAPLQEGPVLLCEGESDCLCAISHGFNAITQTTKPKKWSREHLKEFKGRDVVIAYDADQAGQKYAFAFAAPELIKVAASVKILEWPDEMGRRQDGNWPEDHGQDLTDFFVKHSKTAADLQGLINAAEPFQKSTDEIEATALEFFERGVNDRLSFKPRLLTNKLLSIWEILSEPMTGLTYKWNGKHWETFHEDHLKKMALRYLGNEAQRDRVNDAVFQAKTLSTLEDGRKVNDHPDLICLDNGMFNLKTLELSPHDQDYLCTFKMNVSYNPNSKARCSKWEQFLQDTVQSKEPIMQLQEFMGYCLTKETSFTKCLLLIGDGGDGKSVFLNILRALVGEENCSSVSFQDLDKEFNRASLYQKSVNIASEVSKQALESSFFKAIVAGDPIEACFKHKDQFSFRPYAKLAFACNNMPRVMDNSDGFFRRILPVKFKRQFEEDDPNTDPFLEDKLMEELSEIFLWALAGLHRLWKNKRFTDCAETRELLIDYRRQNNPVMCYVEDKCLIGEGHRASKADLYADYSKYCIANGYLKMGGVNFFKELYTAVKKLKAIRPRINGKRVQSLEGIGISAVI